MGTNPEKAADAENSTPRQWARVIFVYLLIPIILFGFSRDLAWTQAWLFSVMVFGTGIGGRVLAELKHPGLMVERQHVAQDVKGWDKVLAPLMAISIIFPHVIVAGLDHYHGWTTPFPLWLQTLAGVLILLGYSFTIWALVENRFFSTLVRIQTDRGHTVCDSGPYRFIRHPGYAGDVFASFLITFLLGSWWVMVPAVLALIIAVIRTELEDSALISDLPGYQEYASRVRYRLIPGLW